MQLQMDAGVYTSRQAVLPRKTLSAVSECSAGLQPGMPSLFRMLIFQLAQFSDLPFLR